MYYGLIAQGFSFLFITIVYWHPRSDIKRSCNPAIPPVSVKAFLSLSQGPTSFHFSEGALWEGIR